MRRFVVLNGQLMIEPDLPPGVLCGGYAAAYLPELTDDELRIALGIPGLSTQTLHDIRAVLDRRTVRPMPAYLCSVWLRGQMTEDARRKTETLINRLRSSSAPGDDDASAA